MGAEGVTHSAQHLLGVRPDLRRPQSMCSGWDPSKREGAEVQPPLSEHSSAVPAPTPWSKETVATYRNGSVVLLCYCEGEAEHTLSRSCALVRSWSTAMNLLSSDGLSCVTELPNTAWAFRVLIEGTGTSRAGSLGLRAGRYFQSALNRNVDQQKKYIIKWLFKHHCKGTQYHQYFYGMFAWERDCERHYSVKIGIFSSEGWHSTNLSKQTPRLEQLRLSRISKCTIVHRLQRQRDHLALSNYSLITIVT